MDLRPDTPPRQIYTEIIDEMSGIYMSSNDYTVDADELVQIGKMCKELKKEKDMLREALLQEKSKNAELSRRMESDANAASEAHRRDKKYIYKLERELRNCFKNIGYLEEQLNLQTVEADHMREHIHSLDLKFAETEKDHEKIKMLIEKLEQSDSNSLILLQELDYREKELRNSFLHVEELETALSSIVLESQCEVECMKFEIEALEQRCFEAESFSQQTAQDSARRDALLEGFKFKFQEAMKQIEFLKKDTKQLEEKLVVSKRSATESSCKVGHLDNWMELINRMIAYIPTGPNQDFLVKLREEFMLLQEVGTCEEFLGPFLSKLDTITAWDDKIKNETEKMSNEIHESDATIKKLKEDLREEKQKAKEEAEDLIQAMAELRYQMTCMLEEECKHRACIEQASLQRIQDLEAQVRKEQKKYVAILRRFQEAHEQAKVRSIEVRRLQHALEGLQGSTDLEMPHRTDSCSCADCMPLHDLSDCSSERSVDAESSDDICNTTTRQLALVEWYPDTASLQREGDSVGSGAGTNGAAESL